MEKYVVGECCESSDILTCQPNKPGELREEEFDKMEIGDLIIIGESGTYVSGMSLRNCNSKPRSAEFWIKQDDTIVQIRKAEKREDVWENDILV